MRKHGFAREELTPAVQKCVSAKLSAKGGTPDKQDIAIAISECRQAEANSKVSYQTNFEVPGGEYTADQNEDGTWNIRDVELYAAHERRLPMGLDPGSGKLKFKVIKVGVPWLKKAIAFHRFKRDKEKFLNPLHINHHEYCGGSSNEQVKGGGFIMPTGLRRQKLEGKPTIIMIGDLLALPPEVYKLVRENKLPYRSAEILDLNETIISSVSLMEHHVPWFAFPLLTIGKEIPFGSAETLAASVDFKQQMAAAVGYSHGYERRTTMAEDLTEEEKKKKEMEASAEVDIDIEDDPEKKKEASLDDDDDPEKKKESSADNGGLEAKMDMLLDLMRKLLGEEKPPEMEEESPVDVPVGSKKGGKKTATEKAGLQGQIDGLKSRLDRGDTDSKTRTQVKAIASSLMAYNLGSDLEDRLFKMGLEGAKAYAKGIKDSATPMPSDDVPLSIDAAKASGKYPKEVMAYMDKGIDVMQKAHAAYQSFEEAKAHGLVSGGRTLEDWIKDKVESNIAHNLVSEPGR